MSGNASNPLSILARALSRILIVSFSNSIEVSCAQQGPTNISSDQGL
jgi:hypothetical protein